jgi:hypothetical protein
MSQTHITLPSTPAEWSSILDFKAPQEKDTVGLVNMKMGRGGRISLIDKDDDPVSARPISIPLECYSVEDLMGKGKGQLSLTIELTPKLWNAFNALDKCFDNFMVTYASKLFSKQDAEYIKKDPGSIALKHPKPLARFNPDGSPKIGGYMNLRITGRGAEVEDIIIKDGPKGQYVEKITFCELTIPLIPSATRFAMVKKGDDASVRSVRTTLPRSKVVTGGQKTRLIGPGDFQGGFIVGASITVSHWALVNGSASLCIKASDIIFDNVERDIEVSSSLGFVIDNEDDDEPEPVEDLKRVPVEEMVQPPPKRRLQPEAVEPFSSVSKTL